MPQNRQLNYVLSTVQKTQAGTEAKEFIFKKIRQKDLKDPNIAIPMAVRWLQRQKETATSKLKKAPTHEEIILEYKGLLKSNSEYKKAGLKKYREAYEALKK